MCLHQSSPLRRREDTPGTLSLVMELWEPRAHRHPAVSASPLLERNAAPCPPNLPAARKGAHPGSARRPPAARSL